ncbi:hypothetical protein APR64_09140 [Enterobacter hormaechei]|nr:hypothetical protein APR64_09140 [Enterobacter hormaechei]
MKFIFVQVISERDFRNRTFFDFLTNFICQFAKFAELDFCTTDTVCIDSNRTRNYFTEMIIEIMIKQQSSTVINSSQVSIMRTLVN